MQRARHSCPSFTFLAFFAASLLHSAPAQASEYGFGVYGLGYGNHHFPFGLAAGVGGYFYQQLSGDSGSGAVLGPFRGRVAAVGPLLAYTFKVDTQQVTLSGRWFHEFDVKRRVRGDAIFASLSFPL